MGSLQLRIIQHSKKIKRQNALQNHYNPPTITSKLPVPTPETLPRTIRELGDLRSSKSPSRVASLRNWHVVSKLIFINGETLDFIPCRLKGA